MVLSKGQLALPIARFLLVLGLLVAPWPGLGRRVSGAFTDTANALWAPILGNAKADVSFVRAPESAADGDWDTVVLVKSVETGQSIDGAAIDIRRVWYLPMVVFVALSLALARWGFRGLALFLTVGFITLPALSILPVVSFLTQIQVLDVGSVIHAAFDIAYRALVAPLGMAYALPAFLWLGIASLMPPLGLSQHSVFPQ